MLWLGSLVLGLTVAADSAGALRVSASDHRLAVVAQGAPLSVVLEEIGRRSGTRITYDGAVPATPVTCDFVAATPAEAFVRTLEGLGLSYVIYGGTVEQAGVLLVSAPSGPAGPRDRAGEAAEPPDDDPGLAIPPPGGAIPPRFWPAGQEEPEEAFAEEPEEPAASTEDVAERPPMPSPAAEGQAGGRERMENARRRHGAGTRPN